MALGLFLLMLASKWENGGSTGGSPPSTKALVSGGTVGGASLGTTFGAGSGQQTFHTQQKATQMPVTHMPTQAPSDATPPPSGSTKSGGTTFRRV